MDNSMSSRHDHAVHRLLRALYNAYAIFIKRNCLVNVTLLLALEATFIGKANSSTVAPLVIWRDVPNVVTTNETSNFVIIRLIDPCQFQSNLGYFTERDIEICRDLYQKRVMLPLQSICPNVQQIKFFTDNDKVRNRPLGLVVTAMYGLVVNYGLSDVKYINLSRNVSLEEKENSLKKVYMSVDEFNDDVRWTVTRSLDKTKLPLSTYLTRFYDFEQAVLKILTLWQDGRHVSELFMRLGVAVPCPFNCDKTSFEVLHCQVTLDDTIIFHVAISEVQTNLKLLKPDPFKILRENNRNETCLYEYDGPKYLIANIDLPDCVYEPSIVNAQEIAVLDDVKTCPPRKADPGVGLFKSAYCISSNEVDYSKFQQLKHLKGSTLVYCEGSSVNVNGVDQTCGSDPFSIPSRYNVTFTKTPGKLNSMKNLNSTESNPTFTVLGNSYVRPVLSKNKTMINVEKPHIFKQKDISVNRKVSTFQQSVSTGVANYYNEEYVVLLVYISVFRFLRD